MIKKPILTKSKKNLKKGYPYIWERYSFIKCDHTLKYQFLKNVIIAESCLTPKLYEYFNDINNKKVVEKIFYKTYSLKTLILLLNKIKMNLSN